MAKATEAQEFYTAKELAAMLQLTETTIYRMARRGELPYYTIGRSMRFRQNDVEEFLKQCHSVSGANQQQENSTRNWTKLRVQGHRSIVSN